MTSALSRPAASESGVRVEQLLQTLTTNSGSPIEAPDGPLQAIASKYHVPPVASLPVHKHPYQRFGYMLTGRLIVTNAQTHQSREFKAGDLIVEDVDIWHQARNPGDEQVDLLVIDLVKPMAKNVILHP